MARTRHNLSPQQLDCTEHLHIATPHRRSTTRERKRRKVHQNTSLSQQPNIPICVEKRSIIETLPTNDNHPWRNATHVSLYLSSTFSSALTRPQRLDHDPLRNHRGDPNPARGYGTHTQVIPIQHTRSRSGPRTDTLPAWTWTWQR